MHSKILGSQYILDYVHIKIDIDALYSVFLINDYIWKLVQC